ncbi:MAG: hypothetical protein AAGE93_02935, partial [Bacteroidota bacterium]
MNQHGVLYKTEITDQKNGQKTFGLWHSLQVGNFDQDGDTDIIAGNLVLNTKLRKPGGSGKS